MPIVRGICKAERVVLDEVSGRRSSEGTVVGSEVHRRRAREVPASGERNGARENAEENGSFRFGPFYPGARVSVPPPRSLPISQSVPRNFFAVQRIMIRFAPSGLEKISLPSASHSENR